MFDMKFKYFCNAGPSPNFGKKKNRVLKNLHSLVRLITHTIQGLVDADKESPSLMWEKQV